MLNKNEASHAEVEDTAESSPSSRAAEEDYGIEHKVTASAVITVIAIVFVYMAHMLHVTGLGFLSHYVTSDIGGEDKTAWMPIIFSVYPTVVGPSMSQIADFWGRKWLVVGTAFISVIGCIILSRSNSIGMALGASVIASASGSCQSILHAVPSEVLPRKYRAWAQGAIVLGAGVGAIFGLYAAGAMIDESPSGWRSYYYMLAGTYFIGGSLVTFFYRPPPRQEQSLSVKEKIHSLDIPAMLLILISLLTFCVGLGFADNPYPWTNAHVLAPFLFGVVSLIVLVCYAVFYNKHGMFDHDLYRTRNFPIAQAGVFVESVAFIGMANYFGRQLSMVYAQTVFRSGLIYSIVYYTAIVATILTGMYCSRTKRLQPPVVVAFVCFIIYFILMATTTPSTPVANLWGYNVFIGIGLAAALNPLIVAAQLSIPARLISTGTGLIIGTRGLGAAIGLAIFNAIFNAAIKDNLASKILAAVIPLGLPEASQEAFIGALASNNQELLSTIPGVTPTILQAGYGGLLDAYAVAFRNVYICGGCFSAATLLITWFIVDPKDQFTSLVDAPVTEVKILQHKSREKEAKLFDEV